MKNGIYKPASAYAEDGFACLRMYNIGDGKLVWRDIKRMRLSKDELAEYRLLPGDLLVNRVNSRELVGKAAVIPEGIEPLVFESKNIRLRLAPYKANPKFINYQLLLNGRRHFSTNAQQVVGMASVNQKQLADFPIVLPPLSVQQDTVAEIEKQFSRLDEAVASLKRIEANLKRYKAAILKAAVEGKLALTKEPWKQIELGDIATSIKNGYSKKPDAERGTRIFRISAVRPMKLDASDVRHLSGVPSDRRFSLARAMFCSHDTTEVETMSESVREYQQVCLPRFIRTNSYECVF
jgi:type I restriction enzyme S subunit